MATPTSTPQYLPYSDSVETKRSGENETISELASTMRHISEIVSDRARHAFRSVHAKSHGLLKAQMRVLSDIPEYLQQGIFQSGVSYPVVMRFSTNPGDILPDSISSPRGLAVKIIGIANTEMLPDHQGQVTQDFVLVNGKAFAAPDAAGFLKVAKLLEGHAGDSESLKQFVSTGTRLIEDALELVGKESGTLRAFGHPETNVLGESYFSQVPIRYGQYIAKVGVMPVSENLKKLTGKHVSLHNRHSGLRDEVVKFFETETAEWDVCVQLCTDLEKMPVEDASVEWPEKLSPYVPVARIAAGPQNVYSPERRVYFDERLSFNPWHGVVAHRPLGNIMRARYDAYKASSQFRHSTNGLPEVEPKSIDEIPD